MTQEYTIHKWFPKTIYASTNVCLDILSKLETECEKLKEEYGTRRNPALYVDSSHLTVSSFLKNKPPFDELAKQIKKHASNYANELGYDVNEDELYISNMWFNISDEGDFNFPHAHGNADFSGVFYVKAIPENVIVFYDPEYLVGQYLHPRKYTEISYETITYNCIPASLLIWRSNFVHATPRQMNKGKKIAISFNLELIRNYSDEEIKFTEGWL